jgi:sulfite exporter TauE/SafE
LFPPLFQSNRLASKLTLGLLTGFLPCGLSWAMIGKAATTQNIPGGFLTMVACGLGTVPLLFFTGVSASLLSMKTRLVGERIAGLAVIVMGLILVFKGGRIFV